MADTAVKNRIKTKFFAKEVSQPTVTETELPAFMSWVLQEDIQIKGVFLAVEIDKLVAEWDSGLVIGIFDVSRVGFRQQDGCLIHVRGFVECASGTVGAGVSEFITQNAWASDRVWFPDGMGIDMDEGEVLYVNGIVNNEQANTHVIHAIAIVYYVER